jgi:tetratricopeptide (TPR) repeat protein
MEQIDNLKELINQGDVDTAIKQLDQLLQDSSVEKEKDTLYYLRGNAYRKKGDWKQALDNYQYAIEEDGNRYPQLLPQGYVQSIKEMYNQ